MKHPERRWSRDGVLLFAVTVLAIGIILSFWRLHTDNNDAALYTILARRLVEERTPFLLHWLPTDFVRPTFYEHPPLFIWIQALLISIVPGFDLRLLGALCGVLTVVCAFLLGREIVGARASFLGCVILVATEPFSAYQALARLDEPLVLSFTASMTVLVLARGRVGWLFLGGLIAGLGSLVKGPPALGAPVAAVFLIAALGHGSILRRPQSWLAAAFGALLPAFLFLAYDRLALQGQWWDHYVVEQVLSSAAGGRRGTKGPFALLGTNFGRFWPGLPFAALALVRAGLAFRFPLDRPRTAWVRLALFASGALVYAGFASSGRSYWWYLLPAYVPFALLAGAGVDDLLPRSWADRFVDRAGLVVLGLGVLAIILLPFKVMAPLERPCPFGDLPAKARSLAKEGGTIVLVSPDQDYGTHVAFGEHCWCDPVLVSRFQDADRPNVSGILAPASEPITRGWKVTATYGHWALVERAR